jgi:hypothetical protein
MILKVADRGISMETFERTALIFCIFACLYGGVGFAQQGKQQGLPTGEKVEGPPIRLVAPMGNTEVIGKKPDINVDFTGQFENLLVMLDGTDVTQLIRKTGNGFTYRPVMDLAPGAHTLKIIARDKEGNEIQEEYSFQVKHYKAFDEASSSNQLSVISETYLGESGYADTTPYRKVEGNIKSDNKMKKGAWEATLNTNVRYLEQSEPPLAPQKRGFDVANWTFTGAYNKETARAKVSLGDVSVNESPYTVWGLSRKGTVFEAEYDRYQARAFMLRSEQSFGLDGGIGTDGSMDDHIFGTSFGVKLFNKKTELRATYINGGDASTNTPVSSTTTPADTYGTSTATGSKRGEVFSFLMTTSLVQDKLKIEAEAAFSNYNPDTSINGVGSRKDGAYRVKAEGTEGIYNYSASYEYIGRDFGTVGNQGAERDKQRLIYANGLRFDTQSITLTLLRANDNVRNDSLFGRNINYNGNLAYSYTGIRDVPISFNYVKDRQRNDNDPNIRINKDTDTLSGSINYTIGKWAFGFMPAFSYMNDKALSNVDTQTVTYTFTPAYNGETFSASSSLSLNRTFTRLPHLWTDTYTAGLNLRKDFLEKRLVFDSANTYTKSKTDDRSSDMRTLNLTGTLSYNLKDYFGKALEPAIALRSSYMKITDKINSGNDKEEIRSFLVLTLAAPFLF